MIQRIDFAIGMGAFGRVAASMQQNLRLLLDENGVRVPMNVFGLAAKQLTRNGRHEKDYHNFLFPQTPFQCLGA